MVIQFLSPPKNKHLFIVKGFSKLDSTSSKLLT